MARLDAMAILQDWGSRVTPEELARAIESLRESRMDEVKLSSGRVIDALGGQIGISDDLSLGAGADNGLCFGTEPGDDPPLTEEERIELAQLMIDRWERWRDRDDG